MMQIFLPAMSTIRETRAMTLSNYPFTTQFTKIHDSAECVIGSHSYAGAHSHIALSQETPRHFRRYDCTWIHSND
jgi:hypothetical protein